MVSINASISTLIVFSHAAEDLLASTSMLLDHLLNASEQLLRGWVDRQLVEAICEAAQQIR